MSFLDEIAAEFSMKEDFKPLLLLKDHDDFKPIMDQFYAFEEFIDKKKNDLQKEADIINGKIWDMMYKKLSEKGIMDYETCLKTRFRISNDNILFSCPKKEEDVSN